MDFEPSIRKVPLLLNSVNIDGMLVKFLLKNDVDHQISSETFVYRPNRPFLFPLSIYRAYIITQNQILVRIAIVFMYKILLV